MGQWFTPLLMAHRTNTSIYTLVLTPCGRRCRFGLGLACVSLGSHHSLDGPTDISIKSDCNETGSDHGCECGEQRKY